MKRRITIIVLLEILLASCQGNPSTLLGAGSTQNAESSSLSLASDPGTRNQSTSNRPLSPTPNPSPLPYSIRLNVPFAPQAPFAIWDPEHNEACEEMSLILVNHYLKKTGITLAQAEQELQDMIAWETKHGDGPDITVAQLAEVAEKDLGLHARILENPTTEDVKRELAAGNPVILPLAGRDIGNPYYSGEGPWYHMLVVSGYNDLFFITQDVGTRRGQDYEYRYDTLMNAVHDWPGVKENIRQGERRALVIEVSSL